MPKNWPANLRETTYGELPEYGGIDGGLTLNGPCADLALSERSKEAEPKMRFAGNPYSFCGELTKLKPKDIVDYLDKSVIGQNYAKKVLACAIRNYILRKEFNEEEIPINNLLLFGPTGVGKSVLLNLIKTLARVPIIGTQMSGKTEAGYVGQNFLSCFTPLFEDIYAHELWDNCPYGIILVDEIDKVATGQGFDEGLQDELIGILDKGVITNPRYERSGKGLSEIYTKNLLFIGAGAFQSKKVNGGNGLEGIVKKRLGDKFDGKEIMPNVIPEDLIEYGLKPELVGRFRTRAHLNPLNEQDLLKILTDAKGSSLEGYKKLFEVMGYRLNVPVETLKLMASYCTKETGARALNTVCDNLFLDVNFSPESYVKNNQITIDLETAKRLITLQHPQEKVEKHIGFSMPAPEGVGPIAQLMKIRKEF